jgi:hypothetical protein
MGNSFGRAVSNDSPLCPAHACIVRDEIILIPHHVPKIVRAHIGGEPLRVDPVTPQVFQDYVRQV